MYIYIYIYNWETAKGVSGGVPHWVLGGPGNFSMSILCLCKESLWDTVCDTFWTAHEVIWRRLESLTEKVWGSFSIIEQG